MMATHVYSVTLGSYFCHAIKLPNTRFTDVTLVYNICQSTKKGRENGNTVVNFFRILAAKDDTTDRTLFL